ncbi:lamin-B receptor [Teleopsis dalmanni]|uniref:lamin-B receptor n=1 Tax=Teleopsis dalmanni TaxID=139649 RepID=UPI0018CD790E|nr:lamin-B receptor [Teleopsis dalmanni]
MDTRRKRGRPTLAALNSANITTTNRRVTRGSPSRRASPTRARISPLLKPRSPVRRSSRPRSTVLGSSAVTSTVIVSPTIEEETQTIFKEETTTTISRVVDSTEVSNNKKSLVSTSSVHSSTSQETIEIRSGSIPSESNINKITNLLRRSVSKSISNAGNPSREATRTPTFTNTEDGSRYSRSISRSIYEDEESKAEFSDNEDEKVVTEPIKIYTASSTISPKCRILNAPREFGGWIGVLLLMLTVPALVVYLVWTCMKTCTFKTIGFKNLEDLNYVLKDFFAWKAVYAYLIYFFTMFILSASLFGRKVRLSVERGSTVHHFNLLPVAIVINIVAAFLEYQKYAVVDFILDHYLEFLVYGIVHAFISAFWSYLSASKDANPRIQMNAYGKTGNCLIDYAQGREVNPKCFGVIDLKQVYYRMSVITTLLYVECFLYKSITLPSYPGHIDDWWKIIDYYLIKLSLNPVSLLTCALILIYLLDNIIFEHHLASSFELQGEGFGCLLLLRYATTPYLLTAVSKYFSGQQLKIVCTWSPYVALCVLISGVILKRLSNAYKYKYRVEPTNNIFYGVDTIHTFQGSRLLLGKLWGTLRQPNYTGEILALIGLALPIFMNFKWPPLICVLLLIVQLIHRTKRVHSRNAARYHSSWVRYCCQVRNVLVPRVY